MKKFPLLICATLLSMAPATAQNSDNGALTPDLLRELRSGYVADGPTRALHNAVAGSDIDKLARNADAANGFDTSFSNRVESKGITNQRSSGRCWLFTGLNVLRAQMMSQNNLDRLELSQNYNFFYDQLEKANLFLQSMIDLADRPDDDKTVDWLFKNPMSDGGQFTGLSDNIMKYGVVPAEVMKETYSSNNTTRLRQLLSLKLREDGLKLRRLKADGNSDSQLTAAKQQMLADIYQMLAIALGEPPTEFTWTRKDSKGNVVDRRTYSPLEFYNEYAGNNLRDNYVMLMNDPTRPYYKLYEIDLDRHTYDGKNWTYINLPVEEIKKIAIESIKDSTMMYFSCDVGKFLDRDRGVIDPDNFDYASLFGVDFGMDKADRIRTYASGSTHAMTLMAVDLDKNGKPVKWMVENSWGDGPNNGHLIFTDKWFDEYMFRLVADKKYVGKSILDILKQEPTMLPAWDPMFADEK